MKNPPIFSDALRSLIAETQTSKEEAIRAALQAGKRVTLGNRDVALFGSRIVVSFKTGRGASTFAHVSLEELNDAVITD